MPMTTPQREFHYEKLLKVVEENKSIPADAKEVIGTGLLLLFDFHECVAKIAEKN